MKGILIVPNFALLDPTWRIFWGGFLLHKLIFIFNFAEIQGEQKKKKKEKKDWEMDKCLCCRDSKQPLLFNVCPKQTAYKSGWVKKWSTYIIDDNSFTDR